MGIISAETIKAVQAKNKRKVHVIEYVYADEKQQVLVVLPTRKHLTVINSLMADKEKPDFQRDEAAMEQLLRDCILIPENFDELFEEHYLALTTVSAEIIRLATGSSAEEKKS